MQKEALLCCALIIALGGSTSTALAIPQRGAREDARLAALSQLSGSFEALSDRVSPAVVQILATGYELLEEGDAAGTGTLARRRVGGAGVILDPDGYIVTNAHVVEGAGRIRVRLAIPREAEIPGRSILKPHGKLLGAQLVGLDRETDIAVLKVEETGLPHLQLGDSDELRQGRLVFAFGSPLGLENSVSMGVVSSVARQLRPEDPMIYIQTDAPINPGSSGGPLVDSQGRVMGISTFILSQSGGSEGLGFAAPSNIVRNVYRQIKATGYVSRGEIGVHAQTLTAALAEGLDLARGWGVVLGDVYPGGPADRAGLRAGDIVVSLNGKPMENGRQLDVNLYGHPAGETVSLEILRGQERFTVRVPVIERPGSLARFTPRVTPEENLVPSLSILAVDLTRQIAEMLPAVRHASGVVVAARSPDAVYGAAAGLVRGDIIYAVNRQRIENLTELRGALERVPAGDPVVLHVERRGRLRFLAVEVE